MLCVVIDTSIGNGNLLLAFNCIYWVQYSFNFFIYALRSDQFRKAYLDYLASTWKRLKRCRLLDLTLLSLC